MADCCLNILSKRYDLPLHIDSLSLQFDKQISVKCYGVSALDSLGESFLQAERIDIIINSLSLFQRSIDIQNIRLIRANVALYRQQEDSNINIASILSKISESGRTNKAWKVKTAYLLMKDCSFSYDVWDQAFKDGFDPNHIHVYDLSMKSYIAIDQGIVGIRKLSFQEICGFKVDDISTQAQWDGNTLAVEKLDLVLPKSYLHSDSLQLNRFESVDSMQINQSIHLSSSIDLADIFPLVPEKYRNPVLQGKYLGMETRITGQMKHLAIHHLSLQLSDILDVTAEASIRELGRPDKTSAQVSIPSMSVYPEAFDLIENISGISISETFHKLGPIHYQGELSIIDSSTCMSGYVLSKSGILETQARIQKDKEDVFVYNLSVEADSFLLKPIVPSELDFGEASFRLNAQAKKASQHPLVADIDLLVRKLNINGYAYHDHHLTGHYNNKGYYTGRWESKDENCLLDLDFRLNRLGQNSSLKTTLDAKYINLAALSQANNDSVSELSFQFTTDLKGNSIDDMLGAVRLDSLCFLNKGAIVDIPQVDIDIREQSDIKHVKFNSTLLSGWIYGQCHFTQLWQDIRERVLVEQLPSVFTSRNNDKSANDYVFNLSIRDTREVSKALSLPLSIPGSASLQGYYSDKTGKLSVKMESDKIIFQEKEFIAPALLLSNPNQAIQLAMETSIGIGNSDTLGFDVQAQALDDKMDVSIQWEDRQNDKYTGRWINHFYFDRSGENAALRITAQMDTTDFVIKNEHWTLSPSLLEWQDKQLNIEAFRLIHNDQYIKIDGSLSNKDIDTLQVRLNDVNIQELQTMFASPKKRRKEDIKLGGSLSGDAAIVNLFEDPKINAGLWVENFSLNNYVMGNLEASSRWNDQTKALELIGDLHNNQRISKAEGAIFLKKDSINLNIDADSAGLKFITPYVKNVLSIDGTVYGKINIAGIFGGLTAVTTNGYVENGRISVNELQAEYTFSDTIFLTPQQIAFHSIDLYDKEGNIVVIDGQISHNHFRNFAFDLNLSANHALVIDIEPDVNQLMYGTVYATGSVDINGPVQDIQLDINMRTDEHTRYAISLKEERANTDYAFIEFINKDAPILSAPNTHTVSVRNPMPLPNLNMNLQIEATPVAEITLLMDPVTGDGIKGRGNGTMRIEYNDRGEVKLYGRYTLESGEYHFVIQDLLHRDFSISQGSSITFYGDPLSGDLDIKAAYSAINVPLTDILDESDIASMNLNRTSIPVNCTLSLSGELQQPNIHMGLEFPAADEELRRRIMNIINTDEILNRQVVYLLLLNRFANTGNISNTETNNMSAVMGVTLNTLSNQLNNMIYNALGSDNLSLGFNYRYDNLISSGMGEWQVAMTSQLLDNRLTINGNIGSREDLVSNNTQFIGDFDLEYKLSSSGRWRLKMFNRSNDSRYFKAAMTTQGIGLIYKESFKNLKNLMDSFSERIRKQVSSSLEEADF